MNQSEIKTNKGALLVLVMVYGSIFTVLIFSFLGFVVTQSQVQEHVSQKEKALTIAEAGLNYYKWYLAHNPGDVTHGTTTSGPYILPYADPESSDIGAFSLDIAGSTYCGEVQSIEINSTGYTYDKPNLTRTVFGRYSRPTVAEYAYIINSNVWAGEDRVIIGPYHSNGGIRMDGTNNSTVSSGQESWTCTSSFGCGWWPQTVDGVFGDGPNNNLWEFPVAPINFTGLTVDLSNIEDKARNAGGTYIGSSGKQGYKIVFQNDGTYDLYKVRSKEKEPNGHAWGYYLNKVKNAKFMGNYDIPESCPVIYVEDTVWLEGEVNGKVTLAAADVSSSNDPSIIINDNLTNTDSDSGLLAIAEYDVLIGFDVPDDMTVEGIFIAQEGHFGRNYYSEYDLPSSWDQYVKRNSLTINGSIVSNGRVGTKWTCGGIYCSGFENRYNSYDRNLVLDPPPLTPYTSDDYHFVEWREVE
ncbi:hypothetical protein CL653_00535 [bacterium]|nr:hypothetical protein [bacterium]